MASIRERIRAASRDGDRDPAHPRREPATAALTNNWPRVDDRDTRPRNGLGFDVVIESAVVGLRKPDPRIYELVLSKLGVDAADAVFLDDLGINLKPARRDGHDHHQGGRSSTSRSPSSPASRIRGALMELLWVRHGEPERIAPGTGVAPTPR
jgi:hypothetical protein